MAVRMLLQYGWFLGRRRLQFSSVQGLHINGSHRSVGGNIPNDFQRRVHDLFEQQQKGTIDHGQQLEIISSLLLEIVDHRLAKDAAVSTDLLDLALRIPFKETEAAIRADIYAMVRWMSNSPLSGKKQQLTGLVGYRIVGFS
uniref:Uncharacterized protein n=1 Tax=Cyclophora tenuis TaxID=216820 RepID=A0A7S1CYC1_CYCTE|mmetsp:Transcript_11918/g.20197  ORF Transcript_11918/g.20197 Transcript_11918/m.20197 type:complete len:142 (+) Transcript_11918:103-528(+)